MNKINLGVLTAIVICVALVVSSCSPEVESVVAVPQPVKVIKIADRGVSSIRRFPGKVVASETANIAANVSGKITGLHVQPGDMVKAGTPILEIDDSDFQLNVEQAQANYQLAKFSFDRIDTSRKRNVATQADFDSAKANLDQAKVALQLAKDQLDDTRVVSPLSGTVVKVNPELYDYISAAQTLVTVQSVDNIDIKFQVPSDIVGRFNVDPKVVPAKITFDTVPDRTFIAKMKEFRADSDRSTRGFDITLTMPAPVVEKGRLLPGMDANVLVDLSSLEDLTGIYVPGQAIFQKGGIAYVWSVVDNKAQKTEITMGELQGDLVRITQGLAANDVVVVAGVNKLADGQMVDVWVGE